MRNRALLLAFALLAPFVARPEGVQDPQPQRRLHVEIESQPCWFFGGYHLAAGVRFERLRLRAQVIDSGSIDFEPFGLDNQERRFRRSFDDGSFGLFADWFLSDHWYVDAFLASDRWRIEEKTSSSTSHLRTLDVGLGVGFQYFVYRIIYVQPALHALFRERQSLEVAGERYRFPGVELNPSIRLGVRL